jgi:Protein of unknown function (DUF1997)
MTNYLAVRGSFQRMMRLQTASEGAFAYMTDLRHVLPRLPDIERVQRFKDDRYRLFFATDDGRGHTMSIVFDTRYEFTPCQQMRIIALPIAQQELADENVGGGRPAFGGLFEGEIIFNERAALTEITYRLDILVEIEVPRFLNFIPHGALQRIGDGLMQLKARNIGDGFTHRLTNDYPNWAERRPAQALTDSSR